MGLGKVCKPFAGILIDWTRLNINIGGYQLNEGWILITGGHWPNEAIDKLSIANTSLWEETHTGDLQKSVPVYV